MTEKKKRGRPKKTPKAVEALKETIKTQEEINQENAIRKNMERRRRKFWFH